MYGRLSPAAAQALAENLVPMAQPPDRYPLAAPPAIPMALIYAADDEIFEPDWERFMARELLGIEPIEIPGGHFPMAEDPEARSPSCSIGAREPAVTVRVRRRAPRRARRAR